MSQELKTYSKSTSESPMMPSPATHQNATDAATVELINFSPTPTLEDIKFAEKTDREVLVWHRIRPSPTATGVIVCGVLILVGIVLFLGPGLYRSLKASRATSLALQSEELLKQNKMGEAIVSIRSAYALSPNAPEVLRAMARLLAVFNSPDAMTYWNWLLQSKYATDDDRRAAAECAMQNGLYNQASTMIGDLVTHHSGDAQNLLLAARWSSQRGTSEQTIFFATRAVNDDPAYKPAALFLALLKLSNNYLHQDGINSLFQLADSDDDFGLTALRHLALDPNLNPAEIERVIARLHSHPLAGELDHIAALNLEIKLHPDQRTTLIDQAVTDHQTSSPYDLAAFAEWLDAHGEAPRVLKLIPRERALSNSDLFSAYIGALSRLNQWADLQTLLTGATVPIEPCIAELYLSRCASEMGNDQGSDLHWQRAVSAASYSPDQSMRLALYAEKLGQNDRAAAVYRTLTHNPATDRAAYQGLLRVSSSQDTRTLYDLLDEMISRWPKDQDVESQYVFLNLLLNEHVPEMHQRALKLLANDSNNISHRTNVALACLRLEDPVGALNAYSHVSIDWNTAPIPDLVVYAAMLNANGHPRQAHHLLLTVNRHNLRPEIRNLIKSVP